MWRTLTWWIVASVPLIGCDGASSSGSGSVTSSTTSTGGQGVGGQGGSGAGGMGATCEGDWGTPAPVLTIPPNTLSISSLAITENETALYYLLSGLTEEVHVSTRASVDDPFGPGTAVPELTSICTPPQFPLLDVTHDGLHAYVTCSSTLDCGPTGCALVHASRASTTDPFVVEGEVGSGLGASPAIAADQLTVYTHALEPLGAGGPLLFAERSSRDGMFGPAQEIPGTAGWTTGVIAPEVSPDALELYGHNFMATETDLFVSRRASVAEAFPEPSKMPLALGSVGAADLSSDCRALYFVERQATDWTVYVMRR